MKVSLKELTVQFLERMLRSGSYRGTSEPFWGSLTYGESYTGIPVTENTALNYTAYWACVTLLGKTIASLPLLTFNRLKRGKERAYNHSLYPLLHDEPNPEMDSFTYIERIIYHLIATNGNAYSFIDYEDDLTTIKHLWLMDPNRVEVSRDANRQVVYNYRSDQGQFTIPAYRIWHIPGFGFDGLVGYTPLTCARQAIGLGLATEKFGAKLFSNGTNMGGFLEHPGHMTTEAQKRFAKAIIEEKSGLDQAHKWIVLEEGMKPTKVVLNPEDAQMLQTRKFQKGEMATFFGIPPHKIGDLERATFSNIEEQNIEWVVDTIRPLCVRVEKSAHRKLFSADEKKRMFVEFLLDGLLRGNFESRVRGYWTEIQAGILSPNEAREKENMNPRDGGDVYLQPSNMVPSGTLPAQSPSGDDKPKPGSSDR